MREYAVAIAGYRIRFVSAEGGPLLTPGRRYRHSIYGGSVHDLLIRVHGGPVMPETSMKRVFHASLTEGMGIVTPRQQSATCWSVYKHASGLLIKTTFPRRYEDMQGTLYYSLDNNEWDLYIDSKDDVVDPFEYPLDGLILYYLTVMSGDIFIHGSGVLHEGIGYLFTGMSGSGKTTMAHLWEQAGALVIHDDRVIIRKTAAGFEMHNTPVYDNDAPRHAPLHRIYALSHGVANELLPLFGANAMSRIMSNCIQHNWSPDIIGQLTGSLYLLSRSVPVSGYWFVPDASAVHYLLSHEAEKGSQG